MDKSKIADYNNDQKCCELKLMSFQKEDNNVIIIKQNHWICSSLPVIYTSMALKHSITDTE